MGYWGADIDGRPLSVCPTATNDSGSALKVVRRYSAIHLVGSTSESFLRDYPAAVRSPAPKLPAAPGPVRPAKSEYITKRYGMDFGPTKRVFEPPPRVRPVASNEYWAYDQEPGRISPSADSVSEDGASIVYDSFDFPQPPPIASPLIRRMQSNSWFQDDNGYSQRLSQKQRAALGLEGIYPQPPRASHPTSTVTATDNEVNLWHQSRSSTSTISGHFPTDYLSRNPYSDATHDRENLARIGDMLFGENASTWPDSITASQSDDPRRPFASHALAFAQYGPPNITLSRSTPVMSPYHTDKANAVSHQAALERPRLGRLPRIIRKVASMRSDTQKVEQPAEQSKPLPGPVGHRAIPKARSFRSIFRSSEADESQNKIPVFGNSSNRLSWVNTNSSLQNKTDPRASASTRLVEYNNATGGERKAQFKHQGCYLPSAGDNQQQLREKRRSVNYAEPALQHSTLHHHWATGPSAQRYPDAGSTSFIDLSSGNRDSRGGAKAGGKRERVKDFFSKTGSGLFWWGNQKKNKNAEE
ncbi:hypothetical protein D9619_001825 [Psilocybe cf. subviscida]|uniref:Uncharacterized protein n=1 Tax=Psilocybe cf. subviscida TaxID=2480587 RepID=A0A8H5BDS6_9AGAR|nr:hypothetical protein D9619_001825 [Psilocybe cf. subviscida]